MSNIVSILTSISVAIASLGSFGAGANLPINKMAGNAQNAIILPGVSAEMIQKINTTVGNAKATINQSSASAQNAIVLPDISNETAKKIDATVGNAKATINKVNAAAQKLDGYASNVVFPDGATIIKGILAGAKLPQAGNASSTPGAFDGPSSHNAIILEGYNPRPEAPKPAPQPAEPAPQPVEAEAQPAEPAPQPVEAEEQPAEPAVEAQEHNNMHFDANPNTTVTAELSEYDQQVLAYLNEVRVQNGLEPLEVDPWLIEDSTNWSKTQAEAKTFRHNPHRLGEMEIMAKSVDPQGTVDAWLESSKGHAEIVMSPDIDRIGLGTATQEGGFWQVTTGQPSGDPMKKEAGHERNDTMERQLAIMTMKMNDRDDWGLAHVYSGGWATKHATEIAANGVQYVPTENNAKLEQIWVTSNPDPREYYHNSMTEYMGSGEADGMNQVDVGSAQSEDGQWVMVTHFK